MVQTRCRAGDLAVVIDAVNASNVGLIVKVLALHDGKGDLFFGKEAGPVWLVESTQYMTWRIGKKRYRRKCGPVQDMLLQPIRGISLTKLLVEYA